MMFTIEGARALVTGGLGFIGSNLTHYLDRLGAKVTVIDSLDPRLGANPFNLHSISRRIRIVRGDIRNTSLMCKLVKEQDVVFHCAAQTSRMDSMKYPRKDVDANCWGTLSVLEACRRKRDQAVVVFTSSRACFGRPSKLPVDAMAPDNPLDVYGASKIAAEKYISVYHNSYKLRTTTIRLNNVYGMRAQLRLNSYGVLGWFIGLALRGRSIPVFKPGNQLRDYNFVDDVCDALVLAAKIPASLGQVLLLGSGKPVRLIDLARLVVRTAEMGRVELVDWDTNWKNIDVGDFYVDYSNTTRVLGWKPKTRLSEGIPRTVDFYRRNLKRYI